MHNFATANRGRENKMAAPMERHQNPGIIENLAFIVSPEVKNRLFVSIMSMLSALEEMEHKMVTELLSDSEESFENLIVLCKSLRDDKSKIGLYAEVTIYKQLDVQWTTAFRMKCTTIEKLLEKIGPFSSIPGVAGRKAVPLQKRVLILLFWLAHQDQFRLIGDRFNVSESTAHTICFSLMKIINDNLLREYIRWPGKDRQREISNFYERTFRFPGIVGSIDGTHIEIQQPVYCESNYYNRKMTHSIILQGTCDQHLLLTSINAGGPGRCHDGRIFRRSKLNIPEGPRVRQFFLEEEYHLLGDSGYPLRSYLLIPFKDNGALSDNERKFNKRLSSCRSDIERCFGRIKNRWKKLQYVPTPDPTSAREIVKTCCVLHNFCILQKDHIDLGENFQDEIGNIPLVDAGERDDEDAIDGELKRSGVMRQMGLLVRLIYKYREEIENV